MFDCYADGVTKCDGIVSGWCIRYQAERFAAWADELRYGGVLRLVVLVGSYAEVTVEEVCDGLRRVPGIGFVVRGEGRG